MTQQDIVALINAKIKGQGTNVDAGSVLPVILGGLAEQAFKAVSPDSTDMSEADQMQVRKNLGLYYEETATERLEYDPDGQQVSGSPAFSEQYFIKASGFPIELADLGAKMAFLQWEEEKEVEITSDMIMDESAMGGFYCVFQDDMQTGMPIVTVILADSANPFGQTLTKGVWFMLSGDNHTLWVEHSATYVHKIPSKYLPETPSSDPEAVKYVEQELTEAQQMQARKNQDLYYEGEENTTLDWDMETSGRETGNFYYSSMMPALTAYKVSDIILTADDIVEILTNSYENQNPTIYQESNYLVVECLGGYEYAFIVNQDYTGGGGQANVSKGVYFTSGIIELVYKSTVVHKIPAKYLPDVGGGIETVELLSVPTNFANSVAETTFFSADDWAKVKANNLCVAVLSGTPNRVFLVIKDKGYYTFYGANDIEFILVPYYVDGYVSVYIENGKQIILSGLPTASMTSAELEALGFGSYGVNISSWMFARANTVVIDDLFSSQVLGVIALTSDYLEFWDATNKYVVTLTGGTLACTVTPR